MFRPIIGELLFWSEREEPRFLWGNDESRRSSQREGLLSRLRACNPKAFRSRYERGELGRIVQNPKRSNPAKQHGRRVRKADAGPPRWAKDESHGIPPSQESQHPRPPRN